MAKKSMRVIREYTMITAATFVVAAAVYFFLIPSGVSVGSISGLAMLLGNVVPLPISVLTFILNAALLVVGFLFIGREFGVKTVYTSLILPVFLWVFEQVFPDFVILDPKVILSNKDKYLATTVSVLNQTFGYDTGELTRLIEDNPKKSYINYEKQLTQDQKEAFEANTKAAETAAAEQKLDNKVAGVWFEPQYKRVSSSRN